MIRVYIAGPYSKGDVAANVTNHIKVYNQLISRGYAPYAPLLSHFSHVFYPVPYEKWVEIGIEWLKQCDVVLRMDGESDGADSEVKAAMELGIPVFHSISEINVFYDND